MWNFKQYENNVALISDSDERLTYAELQAENEKLAAHIDGRCLVFTLCNNSVGSVVGYTAFIQNNIVPLLLNAHLEEGLLDNLLTVYKPSYVWVPSEMTGRFDSFTCVYEAWSYCLLKTNYDSAYPLFDELCLLLTTSGSTGSPKLVRQSCANVLTNAQQIAEYLEIDATERPVTTLPMNYTYGLSIINSHLLVGATILLTDKGLMQREFWKFMKDEQATSFGGVPYTYEMLDKLRFTRMDLPALRTMTQAGGKLSPELHKKMAEYARDKGKYFVVMYGACEATARMGYLPYERSLEKYGSCGIPIPGGRFTLMDADDKPIDDVRVTGELVYEGPNVTLGYAECGEDLIKGDERHGVLATGDMAQRDEDGFYFIVGRKKRFLKIFGNRVNLDEVDRLIKAEFDGIDCSSTGVDDHMHIFITDESLSDTVRQFISGKTGLNYTAFTVVCIDVIPRNDSGKVLYAELNKLI